MQCAAGQGKAGLGWQLELLEDSAQGEAGDDGMGATERSEDWVSGSGDLDCYCYFWHGSPAGQSVSNHL